MGAKVKVILDDADGTEIEGVRTRSSSPDIGIYIKDATSGITSIGKLVFIPYISIKYIIIEA